MSPEFITVVSLGAAAAAVRGAIKIRGSAIVRAWLEVDETRGDPVRSSESLNSPCNVRLTLLSAPTLLEALN